MHELGISHNIVAIVSEAAAGRRVRRVSLEIGKLSGVVRDAIVFCFDVAAQGTVLEGATLDINEIDGLARCTACGTEFTMATLLAACPCGSRRLVCTKGEELNIKSMELDEVQ